MNILKAEHLTKTYKQRQVVKDISIQVSSRQIVGLLGPNGAGKTTCFYMIIGLIPSDGGLVTLNRQNITALPLHARAQLGLGYLSQEASVFRKLTVEENILAILETRKKLTPQERTEKCEALIAEFQLSKVRDSMGISLSGGERRRTEIARALAMEPSFILLDEPFAGVDPISVIEIKKQVKHLASMGIGILITDHNVRETLDICDEATIVNEGRVIASGTPQTVLANQQVREVYLGEAFSL